jgi:hypothetical protein
MVQTFLVGASVIAIVLKSEIRQADDGSVKRNLSRCRQGSIETWHHGSDASFTMDWIDIDRLGKIEMFAAQHQNS